jgi:hypothetical protein
MNIASSFDIASPSTIVVQLQPERALPPAAE